MFQYQCFGLSVYMCGSVRASKNAYVDACFSVCVCMYVYACICIYIYMYKYLYICIYICIWGHVPVVPVRG
jgi:hypothetical protein